MFGMHESHALEKHVAEVSDMKVLPAIRNADFAGFVKAIVSIENKVSEIDRMIVSVEREIETTVDESTLIRRVRKETGIDASRSQASCKRVH